MALEGAEVIFSKWFKAPVAQSFPRAETGQTLTINPPGERSAQFARLDQSEFS
jgi:hypothetical protein